MIESALRAAAWHIRTGLRRLVDWYYQFQLGRVLGVLVAMLVLWLGGAFVLYLLERGAQGPGYRFDRFGEAAWGILVYLLSGFEDYTPITPGGRVVSVVVMLSGILLAAYFTALVAAILVEFGHRAGRVAPLPPLLPLRGHVLVLGWNSRGPRLLRAIRGIAGPRPPPLVIVAPGAGRISRAECPLRQVWVVDGAAHEDEVLVRARVSDARSAIVLSGEEGSDPAPAVTAALAVSTLAPQIRSIAPVAGEEASRFLEQAGVAERIDVREAGLLLLAQSVESPGLTRFYDEILGAEPGRSSIQRIRVPAAWAGLTYDEIAGAASAGLPDHVLLGFGIGGGRPVVNPRRRPPAGKPGRNRRLGTEDDLYFLGPSRPQPEAGSR